MWNQCCKGDFTLVTNALAREYERSEILQQCQGIDQSGDKIDSDDGDDDDEVSNSNSNMLTEEENCNNQYNINNESSSSNLNHNQAILNSGIEMEVIMEDSNWQPVTRSKSKRNKPKPH
jgi:hypothetical protein